MTSGSDTPRVFGRSMTPAGLLVLLMVAIDVLLWGVLGAMYFLARQMLATAIVVAGLTVPIQAGLLLTIGPLRAMATQTFRQCIRMKVAVAFIVLLAGALAIIFTQMKGDGTLAGQLRTLLSYGMGVIAFLLSVMTILLGAGLVCNDIRLKTIFSVATKPIPRWQYLLGRWMGLVMVDLALLLPSAGVVYGMAQYFRYQDSVNGVPVAPRDRLAVETEVFTARAIKMPKPVDVEQAVKERWDELQKDAKRFDTIVHEFKQQNKVDDDQTARLGVLGQIRKQILANLNSAGPLPPSYDNRPIDPESIEDVMGFADYIGFSRTPSDAGKPLFEWHFTGVKFGGEDVEEDGSLMGPPLMDPRQATFGLRVHCTPRFLSHLTVSGPVKVDQVFGQVEAVGADAAGKHFFWARFRAKDFSAAKIKDMIEGAKAPLLAEPRFQVSYKAQALDTKGDDTVRGMWIAENPTTKGRFVIWREDPSKVQSTLTFPISAVDDDGNMVLRFVNRSNTSVTVLQEDLGLLYRVSTFESNFARGAGLVLLQVAFLAAVALLCSTFLSYPVAVLVTKFICALALMRPFLNQAVDPAYWTDSDFWVRAGYVVLKALGPLLPDFTSVSASDGLVNGLAFSWANMGETAFVQIAVRVLLLLVLGCLILHRRELAQVQV